MMQPTLEQHARHWEALADEQDRLAQHEARLGWSPNPAYGNRAAIYRAAADALRLEEQTGMAHCCCHLIPMEECRRRAASSPRR